MSSYLNTAVRQVRKIASIAGHGISNVSDAVQHTLGTSPACSQEAAVPYLFSASEECDTGFILLGPSPTPHSFERNIPALPPAPEQESRASSGYVDAWGPVDHIFLDNLITYPYLQKFQDIPTEVLFPKITAYLEQSFASKTPILPHKSIGHYFYECAFRKIGDQRTGDHKLGDIEKGAIDKFFECVFNELTHPVNKESDAVVSYHFQYLSYLHQRVFVVNTRQPQCHPYIVKSMLKTLSAHLHSNECCFLWKNCDLRKSISIYIANFDKYWSEHSNEKAEIKILMGLCDMLIPTIAARKGLQVIQA